MYIQPDLIAFEMSYTSFQFHLTIFTSSSFSSTACCSPTLFPSSNSQALLSPSSSTNIEIKNPIKNTMLYLIQCTRVLYKNSRQISTVINYSYKRKKNLLIHTTKSLNQTSDNNFSWGFFSAFAQIYSKYFWLALKVGLLKVQRK